MFLYHLHDHDRLPVLFLKFLHHRRVKPFVDDGLELFIPALSVLFQRFQLIPFRYVNKGIKSISCMKAVILAAGKGTRMLPLTETMPKVLVPVNGRPFLSYLIDNLRKAGYDELAFVVGYKKEMIIDFLKQNLIKATVITQPSQLGTGHAVRMAIPFVKQENFVVVGGDNLWSVRDLKAMQHDDEFCYIGVKDVPNPEKYGACIVNGRDLIGIVEKPKQYVSSTVNTGLLKLTADIFPALNEIPKSATGEYYLTDAVTVIAQRHKVRVVTLQDDWLDLGCPQDIPVVGSKLGALV